MLKKMMDVVRDEEGASLVEYVLLVALIGIVAIGAMTLVGTNSSTKLTEAADTIVAP